MQFRNSQFLQGAPSNFGGMEIRPLILRILVKELVTKVATFSWLVFKILQNATSQLLTRANNTKEKLFLDPSRISLGWRVNNLPHKLLRTSSCTCVISPRTLCSRSHALLHTLQARLVYRIKSEGNCMRVKNCLDVKVSLSLKRAHAHTHTHTHTHTHMGFFLSNNLKHAADQISTV